MNRVFPAISVLIFMTTAVSAWPGIRDDRYHIADYEERVLGITNQPSVILRKVTNTRAGYSVWCLKFSGVKKSGDLFGRMKNVLIIGGTHALEWSSYEVTARLAERLARETSQGALTNINVYLVPFLNPEGLDYIPYAADKYDVGRKNRFHPKDRRGWEKTKDGVDLNRNYSFQWENSGDDWIYNSGIAPFSEPETSGLKNLASQIELDFFLSFHSPGKVVQYPWGHTKDKIDDERLVGIARAMAGQIGFGYRYAQDSLSGIKKGCEIDWFYGEKKVPSLRIEINKKIDDPDIEEYDGIEKAVMWLLHQIADEK